MKYIEQIQRGVDYIEASLNNDIDINDVAKAAHMSRWHFQRMFRALTGDTVKCYIRTRRLSHSIESLINTDVSILDIALTAGYDSQESFTRAFKQNFGIAPGKFRSAGQSHQFMRRIQFDREYLQHIGTNLSKSPEIHTIDQQFFVGMKTSYYGIDSEKNNLSEKVMGLWDSFLPRMSEIKNAVPNIGYGIIEQTANDAELLNYYSVAKVNTIDVLPEHMMSLALPAQQYATFEHKGNPRQLDNTVNYIYSTWLPQSNYRHTNAADIELYGEEYIPDNEASLIYYSIPIES